MLLLKEKEEKRRNFQLFSYFWGTVRERRSYVFRSVYFFFCLYFSQSCVCSFFWGAARWRSWGHMLIPAHVQSCSKIRAGNHWKISSSRWNWKRIAIVRIMERHALKEWDRAWEKEKGTNRQKYAMITYEKKKWKILKSFLLFVPGRKCHISSKLIPSSLRDLASSALLLCY